jgi:hypothetical protein
MASGGRSATTSAATILNNLQDIEIPTTGREDRPVQGRAAIGAHGESKA